MKIILNPSANRGQAAALAENLRSLSPTLPQSAWAFTTTSGEAVQLARQAVEEGCHTVVAAGGDGTVHEVLNGLMQVPTERRPRLGILPLGSGNDFALACGIPTDPAAAWQALHSGQSCRVDIGEACDEHGNRRFWDNTLGIGFDARVNIRSRRIQHLRGYLIYLTAALQTILLDHAPMPLRFESEAETWEEDVMMLALCNGHREGGAFLLVPEARPDDGVMGYARLARVPRWRTVRALFKAMNGTHVTLPEIRLGNCQRAHIESPRPLNVHTDGEIYLETRHDSHRLDIRLHRAALEVAGGTGDGRR